MNASTLDSYLAESRLLAIEEIRRIMPADARFRPILYDLALDYPLRAAKALRPALCIAACRALGGSLESVLRSAAVLELYHNAFLIHDDVEDGSELRRDRPTLHRTHGAPIAVNVGDAMLALALQPLLDNMEQIGLGRALRVMEIVARMARESAEGQAIELHWIRHSEWNLSDTDYLRMVYKKTSWYSFITPLLVGGVVAGAGVDRLAVLRRFAALLGIAFQIQDDVLNLRAEGSAYGKELAGDLWEGKRTLILMHALRLASPADREAAIAILARPRPSRSGDAVSVTPSLIRSLAERGEITASAADDLGRSFEKDLGRSMAIPKSQEDIEFLQQLVRNGDSVAYAESISGRFARRARQILESADWLHESVHLDFLHGIVDFVVARDR